MHTPDQDELLDVVDAQDRVIGVEKRSIVYQQNLSFRVVNGFVINSQGKFWIPRRTAHKKLFPLALDASVGGHVASGESYDAAFVRETQEELGIDLKPGSYTSVVRLTPHEHGTSAFMWVYVIFQDAVPCYNKNDFVEFYWLTPDEFFERLSASDHGKNDLLIMLKYLKNIPLR